MEGPAFDGFAELEAEVKRLFRSARLWHQVGYRGADGEVGGPAGMRPVREIIDWRIAIGAILACCRV